MPAVLCVAAHPLVPGYVVGDQTELVLVNGRPHLALTPHMIRRLAEAVKAGALVMLGDGPGGGFDVIEQHVSEEWERLQTRIAGIEAAAVRRRLRDVSAEGLVA